MTSQQLLTFLLIQTILVLLPAPGLYKMFAKAGLPAWKALVPFYNTWVMLKAARRPVYLFFCQFVPIAGWFVSMSIFVGFVKLFGRFRLYQHALAALLPLFYFTWLGYDRRVVFAGVSAAKAQKRSVFREWVDAAVFAIIAATLIRTFVFEAFAIPTASMEKSMLSKVSYGPRLPNTPLAVPFIHNRIPFTRIPSYLEWIRIPYTRWFPRPIQRNDVVVFNLPVGDTLIDREDFDSKLPYYDVIRSEGRGNPDEGRKIVLSNPDDYPIRIRPVDKQENFVKRCVGLPGDTLQIRDQVIYINSRAETLPPFSETFYDVRTFGQPIDDAVMKEEYQVDIDNPEEFIPGSQPNEYHMLLTTEARQRMLDRKVAKSITADIDSVRVAGRVFPYDAYHPWSIDEYGPIWIPKKGSSVELTPENYALYERIIRTYEGNTLQQKNGAIYINGQQTNHYKFKMDYFWMMGDNRHNSLDARSWGFVPEDHIVGKASFIFMSWENGVRWSRLLKGIN